MKQRRPRKPKVVRPVHARIKQRRADLDLTQQELADKCGLDKTTVSHWESGKSAPRWWLMPTVAKALKTTVEDLLGVESEAA